MKGLLKFITCGSVDDGKSTLIGHILYDSKLLYTDQARALELDSKVGSRDGAIDYSLLLDGLMAEREQGITIDVAYRYFTTNQRSFIVADTPGHEEYTRNMAVGASFADLSIILVDAKQGVLLQTRRHARICSLMGIRHFVFAVNKMDLVGYSKERFDEIQQQIAELVQELSLQDVKIIPISATEGDNLTSKSENIPWYTGEALLSHLEQVDIVDDTEEGFFLTVQRVCRPNHTFRGFQGQIESGSIAVGDEITALPSNEKAVVKSIHITDQEAKEAFKGQAVTIQLNKEVDVSRGCVLTKGSNLTTSKQLTVSLLWMDDSELTPDKHYFVKLGTKLIPGVVTKINYKVDVNTGEHRNADRLVKNEIAVCELTLAEKIVVDEFKKHKTLGELILIDRITNMTSACGVVEELEAGDGSQKEGATFQYENLTAKGNLFEEFYYNLESSSISKQAKEHPAYTVSDEIPVKGESYHYPDNFDVLALRDEVAVTVRNKRIEAIKSLQDYHYTGYPVIDEKGFAIRIASEAELAEFLHDAKASEEKEAAAVANKWLSFETYRTIVFNNNFWII
ncbi:MAG: sulfate adenylyltransferase, large subunit [Herbinix sp.]|jgi:sulfate adenylyltransferase subunit 1|nr:sulfate adenylyltransferase, large subunit [Herbinix sp.]